MISPATFWPSVLGLGFLVAGLIAYRNELFNPSSPSGSRIVSLGPVFVAAALAAFAGEHFTAAKDLSTLVPKWLPARLFITYFVGVAHVAAALSFVARRCVRWSSIFLALMFTLFVLLLWLLNAISHPEARMAWIIASRETTFTMGALALFATTVRPGSPTLSNRVAIVARFWTGFVLVYFGLDNIRHPQFTPGVPDALPTAAWVPGPHVIAYVVGSLMAAFGVGMLIKKFSSAAGTLAGSLMVLLTLALFTPQLFIAGTVPDEVTAINFVADTLLFAGTLFLITRAIVDSIAGDSSAEPAR